MSEINTTNTQTDKYDQRSVPPLISKARQLVYDVAGTDDVDNN